MTTQRFKADAAAIHARLGRDGWVSVLSQVVDERYLRNRHGPCPACGGKDRFRFDNRRGRGDFYCNGCGAGDGFALLMRVCGFGFPDAIARVVELSGGVDRPYGRSNTPRVAISNVDAPSPFGKYASDLWRSTKSLSGEAVAYLKARALVIPPLDGDLRWIEALPHPSGFSGPALVALVRDPATGAPMTLHRTWIAADGSKRGDPARMCLKGHRQAGGVVMLWPSEAVTEGLGIAEGIESALALAHGMTPVWSALNAGNLEKFPVLNGVDSLLIAADGEPAGEMASMACASRWAESGREVRIVRAGEGRDIADAARAA